INHLFTFVYREQSFPELVLLAGYWGVLCLGMVRIITLFAHEALSTRGIPPACLHPAVIFITVGTVGILALNSFTSVELRFNLVPVGVLCVFGVDALLGRDELRARAKSVLLAVIAACILTACSVLFLSAYGTAGPIENGPKVTLSGANCYTFSSEARHDN